MVSVLILVGNLGMWMCELSIPSDHHGDMSRVTDTWWFRPRFSKIKIFHNSWTMPTTSRNVTSQKGLLKPWFFEHKNGPNMEHICKIQNQTCAMQPTVCCTHSKASFGSYWHYPQSLDRLGMPRVWKGQPFLPLLLLHSEKSTGVFPRVGTFWFSSRLWSSGFIKRVLKTQGSKTIHHWGRLWEVSTPNH